MTRTHAVATPKPCQDRKVAAIRDACDRRGLRVTFFWMERRKLAAKSAPELAAI